MSCIHVSVVDSGATAANPFSYSKSCSTFRTAGGNTPAARTSLGGVVFVDCLEDDTGLMALVFQHRLEHGPARIQRALGHLGFDQLGAGHVAHENGGVAFDQCAAELEQFVFALVSDLGVDGTGAFPLLCPLRNAQRLLMAAIPTAFDLLARGHGGAFLQAQVDAHGGCARRWPGLHLHRHVEIPAAPAVFAEAASAQFVVGQAVAVPQA